MLVVVVCHIDVVAAVDALVAAVHLADLQSKYVPCSEACGDLKTADLVELTIGNFGM